ncbi:DUF1722 domain-containing protein [Aureibacillus halotolerans]|uniref:Uncharacterized protein YbgA (DUF1722 family) n=1 Tax=Aureibacillus halotolerans TaxID=1508390 RepID=A0A4R6TZD8_9BACI|nr:DUF1722 domain-containing protein [Aureibacillus halotolerans]TDQ38726.1 uncharacterized protein YbgA (DUF1722 family) [Aureibacillus halotolerans]
MTEKEILNATEQLWSQNKYNSMAKGYASYEAVKRAFNEATNVSDYHRIFLRIQNLHDAPYSKKALVDTFEHIWGYFKHDASDEERDRFFDLVEACHPTVGDDSHKQLPDEARRVIAYIHRLLAIHPINFLPQSTLLSNSSAWNNIQVNNKHFAVNEYLYLDALPVLEESVTAS